ncbi:MAG: HAD-IA family hydrolase [Acidobacteria bacterium]|nr:HAD-IA family hydrolase [Acidobacteriota bacterium]
MLNTNPQILIFDVDGVLVDVRGSFHKSTLDTVHHYTGKRFRPADILRWKNQSGYNDDWKLSTDWIGSLGVAVEYAEVKRQFQKFYWGANGCGNVALEKWLVSPATLRRLARRAELAIFTGRTRRELSHTFDRANARRHFKAIVTLDDVRRSKPAPEGLLKILDGRDPAAAFYLGDNVDDALAARAAGVPFFGVLRRDSAARRVLGPKLRDLGARAILHRVEEVERWLP